MVLLSGLYILIPLLRVPIHIFPFYSHDTGDISSNTYHSSLKDSNGDLWFGNMYNEMGIDVFISKEGRFIHYTPQGNGSVIYCLFEDNQRNVWIGSNNGLEIYNLITKKKDFLNKENSQLLTNEIKAVSQDKNIQFLPSMLTLIPPPSVPIHILPLSATHIVNTSLSLSPLVTPGILLILQL